MQTVRGVATMSEGISPGEAGGVIAGIVALLYAIGRGCGWLFDRVSARIDKRAAALELERDQLAAWRASLDQEAKRYRAGIKGELEAVKLELGELRLQNMALASALLDVSLEHAELAPSSPVLVRLAEALRKAFKVPNEIPPEMAVLLARLEAREGLG